MPNVPELTLAFLDTHPADAALELQRLPAETSAAFLEAAPARLSAPVLARMLPTAAARCLGRMHGDTAAGLVRAMGLQPASQVLRYLPEDRRAYFLEQFPAGLGLLVGLMLGYPENTVGAWMDPQAATLPPEATAAEALALVKKAREEESPRLFVIGPDRQLLGGVNVPELLRAEPRTRLSQLLRAGRHSLPARATLASIREHEGWNDARLLPVVERHDRFVGALRFSALAHARDRVAGAAAQPAGEGLIEAAATPAWTVFSALIGAVVAVLPTGASGGNREKPRHNRTSALRRD